MLPNLLTRERFLKNGIIGLYKWDSTIFDPMVVPAGVDKVEVINTIFHKYGQAPLQHPDPEYMKFFIGVWSHRNLEIWEKLLETTKYDYNPIHNYDRTEEGWTYNQNTHDSVNKVNRSGTDDTTGNSTTDTTLNSNITRDKNGTDDLTTNESGTNEHSVSAENVSDYQPDTLDATHGNKTDARTYADNEHDVEEKTGKDTTASDSSRDYNETETGNLNEDAVDQGSTYLRAYGNIGVTTTQQMIEAQREVVKFNLVEYITEAFYQEFCLYVYD